MELPSPQVIRTELRAVQRVHARKRKAALLYDVPLGQNHLAAAPEGRSMPQLRPTTDERKAQWMRVRLTTKLPAVWTMLRQHITTWSAFSTLDSLLALLDSHSNCHVGRPARRTRSSPFLSRSRVAMRHDGHEPASDPLLYLAGPGRYSATSAAGGRCAARLL